ncbi:MAG: HDOD domain-containing protein [Planctomycetota bacterium]|nr:MAG: HDOD domain-containing protein [Planctomycetota bacterium]
MSPQPLDLSNVQIPTLPEVVTKLSAMVENPLVGIAEIGRTVREDAAMTTRLLRVANSATVGLSEPVLSVEQATATLGARAVRNLALQAAVIDLFEDLPSTDELDIQLVWRHAILTAQVAQLLATELKAGLPLAPDEYYSCGLVHDIGKLVLLQALGEEYLAVMHDARRNGKATHVAEQEELGYTHVDVGARVAAYWRLPPVLIEALQFHHGPLERIRADKSIAVVAFADQIAYRVQAGAADACVATLRPEAGRVLGIAPQAFERIVAQAAELWPTIQP